MKTVTKINAIPAIPHRKRVAAYARVSRASDAMYQSLSAQVSYYNELIQRRVEWEFVGIYADYATTGTKENRKEFQRLLEDCRARKIDIVITKSVTRFARNTVTTLEVARELKLLDIDIIFEKERIHSMSMDGELVLSFLASYAQEESRSVSENVKWRLRKRFANGEPHGIHCAYGYVVQDGKLEVDPVEAVIVRMLFDDYISGMGFTKLARKLNTLEIPAPCGGRWHDSQLKNMMRNEKYTGSVMLQKSFTVDHVSRKRTKNRGQLPQYFVPNTHSPIISDEVFQHAQQIIAERACRFKVGNKPAVKHIFTSVIQCEICGKNYRRRYGTNPDKSYKNVWDCATRSISGHNACSARQIPEDILMAKSAEVLGLQCFNPKVFNEKIAQIQVPSQFHLTFIYRDGHSVDSAWQYPPRGNTWTHEMRQAARERLIARGGMKRKHKNEEEVSS